MWPVWVRDNFSQMCVARFCLKEKQKSQTAVWTCRTFTNKMHRNCSSFPPHQLALHCRNRLLCPGFIPGCRWALSVTHLLNRSFFFLKKKNHELVHATACKIEVREINHRYHLGRFRKCYSARGNILLGLGFEKLHSHTTWDEQPQLPTDTCFWLKVCTLSCCLDSMYAD